MKRSWKYAAILAMAALLLGGCCNNPLGNPVPPGVTIPPGTTANPSFTNCMSAAQGWICSNRATILAGMAVAAGNIAYLQTLSALTPAEQQALADAQNVISTGNAILAAASCPSSANLDTFAKADLKACLSRGAANYERSTKGMKSIP